MLNSYDNLKKNMGLICGCGISLMKLVTQPCFNCGEISADVNTVCKSLQMNTKLLSCEECEILWEFYQEYFN